MVLNVRFKDFGYKKYGSPGFALVFLDSWSPGVGFIPIKSTKEINQIKKGKLIEKSFMHTKRFNTLFQRWVQFRVGAIPRLNLGQKYLLLHLFQI